MDAVVVGSLLMTLLKNADRVTAASLAQLVNVIAPIMTEPGGSAWRQTTFFPFAITSRLASGVVLRPHIEVESLDTSLYGASPLVDVVITWEESTGEAAVFLVNRSMTDSAMVNIDLGSLGLASIREAVLLADSDIYAANTLLNPERVAPTTLDSATLTEGVLRVELPPVAWAAVQLGE
jgi:alpha-N-arabinofuranosidase